MAREKVCGIYRIENLINHKSYIGKSVDIYDRWNYHQWALNNKQHNNTHLTSAWHKYGADNFEFTIIDKCHYDVLNDREIYWIDYYDAYHNGYNQTMGGDGCQGRIYTEQQIQDKCYPVLQLDLRGNVIKKWDRADDAAEALNICCRSIQAVAGRDGRHKTAGGFVWIYEKDYDCVCLEEYVDTKKSPVRQYSLQWEYIRSYDSMAEAEQDGYSTSAVSAVCRGIRKNAFGYIWTYADVNLQEYIEWYNDYFNIKYIGQYTTSGELVNLWNSPAETESRGFTSCSVRMVLNGKQAIHKGYIFKYITWIELQNINWKGQINYGKYEEYN